MLDDIVDDPEINSEVPNKDDSKNDYIDEDPKNNSDAPVKDDS